MTYRSEWVYLRRTLLSLEVRIAETQAKIDCERAESELYERKGTAGASKSALKHKANQRCYEIYKEQLVSIRMKYLNAIKHSINNYMSNERASMWWDMFLKNMKISEIARKYNISERWANDLKQKFMKEIGNDGTIREIVPNSRKAQRKNGDDKR